MPNHERGIRLSPFATTRIGALLQASPVNHLVRSEAYWLKGEQPGTVQRYEGLSAAYRNIKRLGDSEELDAYIISKRRVAIGLATVIRDQHIIHPTAGMIEGDDIDYWLQAGSSSGIHRAVVSRLCDRQGGRQTFATVVKRSTQEPAKSLSFGQYMDQIGDPVELSHYEDDYYEVARNGEVSQAYRL